MSARENTSFSVEYNRSLNQTSIIIIIQSLVCIGNRTEQQGSNCVWNNSRRAISMLLIKKIVMQHQWVYLFQHYQTATAYCGIAGRQNQQNRQRGQILMCPMAEFFRENRLRWLGHVQRRDTDNATRNILQMTVDGRRNRADQSRDGETW